jgi:hypothetical protein
MNKTLRSKTLVPFFGDVVSNNDPAKLGKVQIRIHHINNEWIDDGDLLWARLISTIPQFNGIGLSPVKYPIGCPVFGVFVDANKLQLPLILGAYPVFNEDTMDSMLHELAKGNDLSATIIQTKKDNATHTSTISQPESPAAPVYPDNMVYVSSSGHTIEIDDTEGVERLNFHHTNGSFIELTNDAMVSKTTGDHYTIAEGDGNLIVLGNMNQHIVGDYTTTVDGNATVNVGENATIAVEGNAFTEVKGGLNSVVAKNNVFDGDLLVTGNIKGNGEIADAVRTMSYDRLIFNFHDHSVVGHKIALPTSGKQ